jgi:hypothetical protein
LTVDSADTPADTPLLTCGTCDKAFHLFCTKTPLREVPAGAWSCDVCATLRWRAKELPPQPPQVCQVFIKKKVYFFLFKDKY